MKLLNEVLDKLIAQAVASAEKADVEDLNGRWVGKKVSWDGISCILLVCWRE